MGTSSLNTANNSQKTDTKPKKESRNLGFIIGGIFIFVLLIGVMIFIMMGSSGKISDAKFSQGTSVLLGESKEIRFNLNEEEHKIQIGSINENSVNLIVQSNLINVTLAVGETKKFDLDDNDFYDLSIKLTSITNGKADLYILKINEQICVESWDCSEWGICENLSQMRVCEDINNCGTEKNKPVETQECAVEIELSCSDKNGTICEIYEECDGTLEDDCCLEGNCTRIATTPCGTDIDCLIAASDSCHPANMTYEIHSSNSTIENINYYYNIEGFEEEDKCKFYTGIQDVTGNFTAAQWDTFWLTMGTEDIEEMLQDIHSGLIATYRNCIFSTSDLEDYLTKIKESDYQLTEAELITYECTGNLYEE